MTEELFGQSASHKTGDTSSRIADHMSEITAQSPVLFAYRLEKFVCG
jgi:hypothetical protein